MSGIFRRKYLWKTNLALHCLLSLTFFLQENPNNPGLHSCFQSDHATDEEDIAKTKALWKQKGSLSEASACPAQVPPCATCWILKEQALGFWSKARLLQTSCRWSVFTIFSQAENIASYKSFLRKSPAAQDSQSQMIFILSTSSSNYNWALIEHLQHTIHFSSIISLYIHLALWNRYKYFHFTDGETA